MPARKITVPAFRDRKARGEKIVVATAYDFTMAGLLDAAGVDAVLVGDSLAQLQLGHESTLPVTMDAMGLFGAAVRRAVTHALVIVDLPFLSYQVSVEEAVRNAGRLVKEGAAEAVKLEGGQPVVPAVRRMTEIGIPVMGHLGMTPQSVHSLGGFGRVQARDEAAAERLLADALALQEAGAFGIVLELVPAAVAGRVSEALEIPTIGIGAGPDCDGQVQVTHDLLGLSGERTFKHARRYAEVGRIAVDALRAYAEDVRAGRFPTEENSF